MSAVISNLLTLHHRYPADNRVDKRLEIYDANNDARSLETSLHIMYINND